MSPFPSLPLKAAGLALVETAMRRRRWVMWGTLLITLVIGAQMVWIETDTDPENMLADDDPVRLRNEELAVQFGSSSSVFIGLINEAGVVSPEFLAAASGLISELRTADGVVPEGFVSFELAQAPYAAPESQADSEALVSAVAGNDLLRGFAITDDGTGLSVLVPLTSKSAARGVANLTRDAVSDDPVLSSAEVRIAGLPLAEEEFGREMFLQMGLFAPLAGMLIFALMLYFFRKLSLVLAAMAVAMVSVIWTMGLLIGLGFTVHIMASMIPIFLMPIAILDSIHVLSEFLDRYAVTRDRRATLRAVYREVMMPITYTTLTTAIAFASLVITPIPPVQVFGAFVAFGVVVAWLMTLVLIPAFIMSASEESLERLARMDGAASNRWFATGVRRLGGFATRQPRLAPSGFVILALVAIPGILLISVNDNPVRWFTKGSEIRQASTTLNETFAGTFQANLLITADEAGAVLEPEVVAWVDGVTGIWDGLADVGASSTFVDAMRVASMDGAVGSSAEANASLLAAASAGPAAPLVASLIDGDSQVANLQLRLTNGDNQAMQRVLDATDAYVLVSPLPAGLSTEWAGETYLNLVWQNKMVSGMFNAFMTTLAVAFVLMVVLFRSVRWAVLAIVPMAGAIIVVYGLAGFIGKDYDMPMAVLSTLVLGIGIDFAIHFIERFRGLRLEHATSAEALSAFFEEPARALTRNAVIIALGFVPLLFASLVPYIIVGALLLAIMTLSWFATIVVLPGVVRILDSHLPLAQSPAAPAGGGAPSGSPGA
jgi:hypothetical protein